MTHEDNSLTINIVRSEQHRRMAKERAAQRRRATLEKAGEMSSRSWRAVVFGERAEHEVRRRRQLELIDRIRAVRPPPTQPNSGVAEQKRLRPIEDLLPLKDAIGGLRSAAKPRTVHDELAAAPSPTTFR